MTWEQKLAAMQALGEVVLKMLEPGTWLCRIPREVKDDALLRSVSGRGTTPEAAVGDCWQYVTELKPREAIVVSDSPRRYVRWNGYMWADVDAEGIELCRRIEKRVVG